MTTLAITAHDFHGNGNYTINPRPNRTLIPDELLGALLDAR